MKPLFTQEQFDSAKATEKLLCQCYQCAEPFLAEKRKILHFLKHGKKNVKHCSKICQSKSQVKKQIVKCKNCSIEFSKSLAEINRTYSGNHFCSKSCSGNFNNKNKKIGNRRSKLEVWLQEQLTNLYPNLQIDYNKKDAIGSELDIFIPSLNIAFELNGIFHYEPIYGVDKLSKIQENDNSKSKSCYDAKIDLCIIDTSGQTYFKPSNSQKYLNIMTNIINERLSTI
jgi:hypothetical protein